MLTISRAVIEGLGRSFGQGVRGSRALWVLGTLTPTSLILSGDPKSLLGWKGCGGGDEYRNGERRDGDRQNSGCLGPRGQIPQ